MSRTSNLSLTRRSMLAGSLAVGGCGLAGPLFAPARAQPGGTRVPLAGVNLAGADFGKLPGTHGREYLYPGRKHVHYYRRLGFGMIRLPFKWERLQPQLSAPFAPDEWARLDAVVTEATGAGLQLVLDPHNYAKRRIADDGWAKEHGIGSDAVPADAFLDFWSRLAERYRGDDRVVFGLMNEPVSIKVEPWLEIVNATIAAIRDTGARNLILVPGVEYSGAHSWFRLRNTVMAGVVDPARRFAFDVHQYFDSNSSGTKPDAVSGTIGSERIEAFQSWAREHGFKAVLGEFNGGRNAAGYNALHDLCQEMSANADVWLGWAAWAGGPRWPEKDMYNLEPWADGRIREQTAILAHYAQPSSADYWVRPGAVLDCDFARDRYFGTELRPGAIARSRKGVALDAPATTGSAGTHPATQAAATIRALLKGEAFTVMIETRELPDTPAAFALLGAGGAPLLQRMPDGSVAVAPDATPRTAAQPLRNWASKRRTAIAFDAATGRMAVGVTGAGAVTAEGRLPALDAPAIGDGLRSGYVCRVTGYPEYREPEQLDTMLA